MQEEGKTQMMAASAPHGFFKDLVHLVLCCGTVTLRWCQQLLLLLRQQLLPQVYSMFAGTAVLDG